MHQNIIGWDIGGAHLKAVVLNQQGEVVRVIQQPCPLWKGTNYLQQAVKLIMLNLPNNCRHAITMTGELVDYFANREQGVAAILQTMRDLLIGSEIQVFAGLNGLILLDDVQHSDFMAIASANWIASAQLAAKQSPYGLFIDIGSTTTDILLILHQTLQAIGLTDYQRLVSGELVYTGVVRTPVMAITQQAVFNGQSMGLMAEYFATMADVYRVTGDLREAHDQSETADGGEKTLQASARRLSRMTGYQFAENDMQLWHSFAQELKQNQKQIILSACQSQMDRCDHFTGFCLIGAGIGRFLVKEIASEMQCKYQDFNTLFRQLPSIGEIDIADCAPAFAVAYLAGKFG